MKASNEFEKAIEKYLKEFAEKDQLFQAKLDNPKKTITDCCNYIMAEVKKLNVNAMMPDEVFKMAVHYYDEDNLTSMPAVNGKVIAVTPDAKPIKRVELTAEEIKQAEEAGRQKAIEMAIEKKKQQALSKAAKKSKPEESQGELTLF